MNLADARQSGLRLSVMDERCNRRHRHRASDIAPQTGPVAQANGTDHAHMARTDEPEDHMDSFGSAGNRCWVDTVDTSKAVNR